MPSAEAQLQVRIGLAVLDLTPCRRLAPRPGDTVAACVRRFDGHCAAIEAVTEHIRHIVPDSIAIKIVAEDSLADIGLENTIFLSCDLKGDASGDGVAMEHLAIRLVLADGDLVANAATYGPKINGPVALILDDGTANRLCSAGDEGQGGECTEKHGED